MDEEEGGGSAVPTRGKKIGGGGFYFYCRVYCYPLTPGASGTSSSSGVLTGGTTSVAGARRYNGEFVAATDRPTAAITLDGYRRRHRHRQH